MCLVGSLPYIMDSALTYQDRRGLLYLQAVILALRQAMKAE